MKASHFTAKIATRSCRGVLVPIHCLLPAMSTILTYWKTGEYLQRPDGNGPDCKAKSLSSIHRSGGGFFRRFRGIAGQQRQTERLIATRGTGQGYNHLLRDHSDPYTEPQSRALLIEEALPEHKANHYAYDRFQQCSIWIVVLRNSQ